MTKCTEAAAREAALVGALEKCEQEAKRIEVSMDATIGQRISAKVIRDTARAALADISPAAAALLAQGEALGRISRQADASIAVLFRDASTAEARREKARELHSGLKDIGDSARAVLSGEAKE